MKQSDVLNPEIDLIKEPLIKEWTKETLEKVPMYFWKAQASSSGKYHPICTVKEGGLIVHVKRVVYLANHICEGWGIFGIDRDIVLSACILHDIAKVPTPKLAHLYEMNTTGKDYEDHPINAEKYFDNDCELNKEPEQMTVKIIYDCIRYHMGRWTPESIKKEIVDYSLAELVVYTADYLASRKDLITPKDN